MAQLIVRNLDDEVVRRLKLRAAEHGRSAEAEHREILRAALIPDPSGQSLKDALVAMPDAGDDADFARATDIGREVELSSYLLDTNVVSELRKGERCNENVARWYGSLADDEIFLSVLTLGEIRRGVELIRRRDVTSAERLDAWLAEVTSGHADRILPVDGVVAERWGRLNVPGPLPVVDGLLAATAMTHGLTLATRNTKDVAGTGVPWVNPFD